MTAQNHINYLFRFSAVLESADLNKSVTSVASFNCFRGSYKFKISSFIAEVNKPNIKMMLNFGKIKKTADK